MTHFLDIGPVQIMTIVSVVLIGTLLMLIALIDIVKSNFKGNDKLIWVLVVIFLHWIGALLYFIIGRKQKLQD
jgi:hypothetical protein